MPKQTKKPARLRYVLDTCTILADPECLTKGFDEHIRIVCGTVLQELDAKKTDAEIGYSARTAGRILDDMRKQGDLIKGVPTPSGGILMFEPDGVDPEYLPIGFSINKPDNRIISSCIHLNRQDPENRVILVSTDAYMRVSATACGIECQDFKRVQFEDSEYTGLIDWDVTSKYMNSLYKDKAANASAIETELKENQFVTLHCGSQSALTVHRRGKIELIKEQRLFGWVTPRNALQTYAMWALSRPADELPLVILEGAAGPGKTFLSLAAGLDATYTDQRRGGRFRQYNKLMITRPVANTYNGEQGMGYLPGTLEEKLRSLYQNYYDNLAVLLRGEDDDADEIMIQTQIDDLVESRTIEIGALAFIRGRSLDNTYLICDEAQNAPRGLIRDVVTRPMGNSKIILAGDPTQIDVPTLNPRNNGLVMARETMAGSDTTAYLRFPPSSSVRSRLALEALKRMVF